MSVAEFAFLKAMTIEGLERFDVLHDAVVEMYESQDYSGMDLLMDLALGTGNRGYVRSLMASVKPVRHVVSEEKFDRLGDFLRKGNEERRKSEWHPVESGLPEEDMSEPKPQWFLGRRYSREVLVKIDDGNGRISHSVTRVRYYDGELPGWNNRMDNYIVAWMDIPK